MKKDGFVTVVANAENAEKPFKNAYLLAKIGADTAENEQHVAGMLPIGKLRQGALLPAGTAILVRVRPSL